jgi:hypothetical protein
MAYSDKLELVAELGGKLGDDLDPYAMAGLCRIARWRRFGRRDDRHSIWKAASSISASLSLSVAALILASNRSRPDQAGACLHCLTSAIQMSAAIPVPRRFRRDG